MTQILTTQVSFGKFIIGSLYKYLKQDFYKSLENNLTNYVEALKIQGEVRISLLILLLLFFFFINFVSKNPPQFSPFTTRDSRPELPPRSRLSKISNPRDHQILKFFLWSQLPVTSEKVKLQKSFLSRISILEERREFFTSN